MFQKRTVPSAECVAKVKGGNVAFVNGWYAVWSVIEGCGNRYVVSLALVGNPVLILARQIISLPLIPIHIRCER